MRWFETWILLAAAGQGAAADFAAFAADAPQVPLVAAVNGTNGQGCHQACESLTAADSGDLQVHYGTIPDSFASSFYALQQREMTPLCVAQPQTATGVSIVVKAVTTYGCPFAIKSGGHSLAPGTSASRGGMVIDLKNLNGIQVSQDNSTVELGPGNLWSDVYNVLEPYGLVVPGGRVGWVGVGGFTMGGGISFLSRRYGWAVDNVVLPNGTITNANPKSNPDLYFALRGGGGSFGIVTRFDFETHPHDQYWGGTQVSLVHDRAATHARLGVTNTWSWTLHAAFSAVAQKVERALDFFGCAVPLRALAESFAALAQETQTNVGAHAFLFFSYVPYLKSYVTGSAFFYSNAAYEPEALSPLTDLPHLYTNTGQKTLSTMTDAITDINPTDQRQHWRTSTFRANATLIEKFWHFFLEETAPLRSAVPDAMVSSNIQLVTKHELALSQKNGGSAFGLKPEDGPLIFICLTTAYNHAKDDDALEAALKRIQDRIVALGKEMGLYHPFIYPNYAAAGQDVFAGFAPENLKRLLEIQSRYDPGRVFANLQPDHLALNDKRVERYKRISSH